MSTDALRDFVDQVIGALPKARCTVRGGPSGTWYLSPLRRPRQALIGAENGRRLPCASLGREKVLGYGSRPVEDGIRGYAEVWTILQVVFVRGKELVNSVRVCVYLA